MQSFTSLDRDCGLSTEKANQRRCRWKCKDRVVVALCVRVWSREERVTVCSDARLTREWTVNWRLFPLHNFAQNFQRTAYSEKLGFFAGSEGRAFFSSSVNCSGNQVNHSSFGVSFWNIALDVEQELHKFYRIGTCIFPNDSLIVFISSVFDRNPRKFMRKWMKILIFRTEIQKKFSFAYYWDFWSP